MPRRDGLTVFALVITLRNMAPIDAPHTTAQVEFNERRWAELVADPLLAGFEGRVETDRYGQIVMSPPPAARHGRFQSRIILLLERLMPSGSGEAVSECPISTVDGVKAADVAWCGKALLGELGNRVCFPRSPEICVEVLSPDNSERQIKAKADLYFQAGANEVWVCDKFGGMTFFEGSTEKSIGESKLCPLFPTQIILD
jgi:Uma2 family endonuclease